MRLSSAQAAPQSPPRPRGATADVKRLPEGVPDAVLVLRARQADRGAESLLYRRHSPALLSTVNRLVRNAHTAEDLVQDAFVRAFERLSQLKTPSQFRPWLLAIVVSLVRKRLRRQRLLQWVGLDALGHTTLAEQAQPTTNAEARQQLLQLDAELKRMPGHHALAWTLRYVEGEKLEDVAVAMNKSLATTKRYIAAAEEHLKTRVTLQLEAP